MTRGPASRASPSPHRTSPEGIPRSNHAPPLVAHAQGVARGSTARGYALGWAIDALGGGLGRPGAAGRGGAAGKLSCLRCRILTRRLVSDAPALPPPVRSRPSLPPAPRAAGRSDRTTPPARLGAFFHPCGTCPLPPLGSGGLTRAGVFCTGGGSSISWEGVLARATGRCQSCVGRGC